MADVLEVTSETLTQDDIQRRVDDWSQRVRKLYETLSGWLPAGWRVATGRTRLMDEELMREFGVGPTELPILELVAPSGESALVEPRGLWIIGANGRVDLTRDKAHFVLIDRAKSFEPPIWAIAPLADRRASSPLDPGSFRNALGS